MGEDSLSNIPQDWKVIDGRKETFNNSDAFLDEILSELPQGAKNLLKNVIDHTSRLPEEDTATFLARAIQGDHRGERKIPPSEEDPASYVFAPTISPHDSYQGIISVIHYATREGKDLSTIHFASPSLRRSWTRVNGDIRVESEQTFSHVVDALERNGARNIVSMSALLGHLDHSPIGDGGDPLPLPIPLQQAA